jgi:hypothetical protein
MATGLFVMAGSLVGGVISSNVYPYIHKKDHFKNIGSGMVTLSTVCGTTLLTPYAANPTAVSIEVQLILLLWLLPVNLLPLLLMIMC